jgi:hypothetical protein
MLHQLQLSGERFLVVVNKEPLPRVCLLLSLRPSIILRYID